MNNFEQSQTYKNLARAFAGECQAGARYQFLASMCEQEKLFFLKSILKQLAKNEMSHAKRFYDIIVNKSESLVKNIEICAGYPFKGGTLEEVFLHTVENERSESENIYPSFAKIASDEGFKDIANIFTMIANVEKTHTEIIEEIWTKLKNKKLYKSTEPINWKCNECGYETVNKQAWNTCPLCVKEQGYCQVSLNSLN